MKKNQLYNRKNTGFTLTLNYVLRRFVAMLLFIQKRFFIFKNDKYTLFARRKTTRSLVSGFTIVETLVAVSIFTVSITALISITAKGISDTIAVKNRVTATALAQEEIEYIRSVRDRYANDPDTGWTEFADRTIAPCLIGSEVCRINDPAVANPVSDFIPCTQTSPGSTTVDCYEAPVLYDDGGYFYQQDDLGSIILNGSPHSTPFLRFFTVERLSDNEIKVTATVTWREKNNIPKNVALTETLTNWRPQTP